MIRTFFLAAAGLAALPAIAQDKPKPGPEPQDDAVVNGNRDKQIDSFVRALTPSKDGRQAARWNRQVCVKIYGLWPERDKTILDRIAAVARQIKVEFKAWPKCTLNTMIVFTDQADMFTAKAIDRFPGLIKDVESFGLPSRKRIAPYLVPRPVRWFAVNQTSQADGSANTGIDQLPLRDGASSNGALAGSTATASRIVTRTRENTIGALIVVDEAKLAGIRWDQLADYLAMVSFAQPAIDADFKNADSIMAIFAARDATRPGPRGLTAQDTAFLTTLYQSATDRSLDMQRDEITGAIKKRPKKAD